MIEEARMKALEDRVTDLRIANGELAAIVSHLANTVSALDQTVQTLRDITNRGRGALWLAMIAAGGLGALAVAFVRKALGVA